MFFFMLARLAFFTIVLVAFGFLGFFLWKNWIRPALFSEKMEEKLTDAEESYVESEVNKQAENLEDTGRRF